MNPISNVQAAPVNMQGVSDTQQASSGELPEGAIKTAEQIYSSIFMQILKLIQSAASEG